MPCPSEWKGSTDHSAGVAIFKMNGLDFSVRLESFNDYQMVSNMLDIAFNQGKRFAGDAMRSHVINAVEKARADHAL